MTHGMQLLLIRAVPLALVLTLFSAASLRAQGMTEPVQFQPGNREAEIPERFRLTEHRFDVTVQPRWTINAVEFSEVTFPSPVTTASPVNNTVHCELFRPVAEGRRPAVVVLHILGGDFALSRSFCASFAEQGVAALFLKMPWYGPRRDPMSSRRMISKEPSETVEGFTQAVLDIRRAVAWLESQPDVDAGRIGIFGISLGGITGALAAAIEPKLQHVCLLLAGGDLAKVAWESRELARIRQDWEARGRSKEEFLAILQEVDPARYGQRVQGKKILLLNADRDEVIPKACTDSLWKAFGEPPIVWYDGTHYTVIRHLPDALLRSAAFFAHGTIPEQKVSSVKQTIAPARPAD